MMVMLSSVRCTEFVASEPKTLYMIRHGESTWNAATLGIVSQGFWGFVGKVTGHTGHDMTYSDAPLTWCGIYQALNLCYELSRNEKCKNLMDEIKAPANFPCKITSTINVLRDTSTGPPNAIANEIVTDVGSGVMYLGASPLVRAIDTLWFATLFASTAVMSHVEILPMIQEIGAGWDATLHIERLPKNYEARTKSYREAAADAKPGLLADLIKETAVSIKKRHTDQIGIITALPGFKAASADPENFNLDVAHAAFYGTLKITNLNMMLNFQHAITGQDRPSLQDVMRTELFGVMNASPKTKFLLGGHSMFFGAILVAAGDPDCIAQGALHQSNGALWVATYTKGAKPALTNCRVLYGGFKGKVSRSSPIRAIADYRGVTFTLEGIEVLESLEQELTLLAA
jgi:broad specificity phosphatase PhoE